MELLLKKSNGESKKVVFKEELVAKDYKKIQVINRKYNEKEIDETSLDNEMMKFLIESIDGKTEQADINEGIEFIDNLSISEYQKVANVMAELITADLDEKKKSN